MAGRTNLEKKSLPYAEVSRKINFNKSVFVFISITEWKTSLISAESSYITISDDIVDLIDISNTLKNFPFLVRDNQILKYINPNNSDSIYTTIDQVVSDTNVENLFIFYQGYSVRHGEKLLLQLRRSISNLSSRDYVTINSISDRVIKRNDLNTIVFLDCSFSAHAFQASTMNNFVIIASSGVDQHSRVVHLKSLERKASLFSYEVIRLFQDLSKGYLNNISLYDFFFELRRRIILLHETYDDILQIPEISTRNIAPYMRVNLENPIPVNEQSIDDLFVSVESLRELVANDRIKECLMALTEMEKNLEPDQRTAIILFRNQYKRNETARIIAGVTNEVYDVSRSSLSRNILEFIGLLELE